MTEVALDMVPIGDVFLVEGEEYWVQAGNRIFPAVHHKKAHGGWAMLLENWEDIQKEVRMISATPTRTMLGLPDHLVPTVDELKSYLDGRFRNRA